MDKCSAIKVEKILDLIKNRVCSLKAKYLRKGHYMGGYAEVIQLVLARDVETIIKQETDEINIISRLNNNLKKIELITYHNGRYRLSNNKRVKQYDKYFKLIDILHVIDEFQKTLNEEYSQENIAVENEYEEQTYSKSFSFKEKLKLSNSQENSWSECNTIETEDASKYIGYLRREYGGRFGTFPLCDDYGDESCP